ncbi:MAG: tetraacyldisaccharide 4'-kinase [Acidobacteriota bacterium]|nr:tetraacyldisaccharide 4'-kinase [Blastocatellia bacterium]MDW8238199.1 tetraacyldisaccharide 4'-kinase [Acidobacteriota bacterium]
MLNPFTHSLIERLPTPALKLLARLYSAAVQIRLSLYYARYIPSRRLNSFTISIGNLSVGGTGKTPLVELLARYLHEQGYVVSILTRGHGRRRARTRQVVSNGKTIASDVTLTGDEPLMLARHLPGVIVIADPDRYNAGLWAEATFATDVHILDDGFQYLRLQRDVNILLIDALDPLTTAQPLPLGRLREPLSEMARADIIIVTNADQHFDQTELEIQIRSLAGDKPLFYAYRDLVGLLAPQTGQTYKMQRLTGAPIAVICGIGNPHQFVSNLAHFAPSIVYQRHFPDHHWFTRKELQHMFAEATDRGAQFIITTEKDWLRIENLPLPCTPPLLVALSELRITEQARLFSLILQAMHAKTG